MKINRLKKTTMWACMIIVLAMILSLTVLADLIFIEAETGKAGGIETINDGGAYNGKCIQSTDTEQTIEYTFSIEKAGNYFIWARVYAESSGDNSYFYSLNGEKYDLTDPEMFIFDFYEDNENPTGGDYDFDPKIQGDSLYSTWYWMRMNWRDTSEDPAIWYNTKNHEMKAGNNTLLLQTREVGAMIDKFIITDDASYDPKKITGDPEAAYLEEKAASEAAAAVVEEPAAPEPVVVAEPPPPAPVVEVTPKTSDNMFNLFLGFVVISVVLSGVLTVMRRKTNK